MSWGTQPVACELRAERRPDRQSLLCVAEEAEGWAMAHQATFSIEMAFDWVSKAGLGQLEREVYLPAGEEVRRGLGDHAF